MNRTLTRQAVWFTVALLAACESPRQQTTEAPARPHVVAVQRGGEPMARIRVQRQAERIRITGPSTLKVYAADDPQNSQLLSTATPPTISRSGGQWIGPFKSPAFPSRATLVIEPVGPMPVKMESDAYPGHIQLVPRSTLPDSPSDLDHFDVVNHVRLEAYLPGVLDRELYDTWDSAAYLAQAIVARSYAIDKIISDGAGRHFDMENTQASQAYRGGTNHRLALRAVADTVGLALTYKGHVLPAYYSSTCGGAGQSALDAFGIGPSLPPLEPKTACSWCTGSRYYQWKTITRDRRDLSKRIAAWGKQNKQATASLGLIAAIRASQTNSLGRPTQFEITDDRGQKFALRSESFRTACNYSDTPPLPDGKRLRSSAVSVQLRGETVYFENGRGYGHCVGLCQYGAQGMAVTGHAPMEILAQYYPGAKVERVY